MKCVICSTKITERDKVALSEYGEVVDICLPCYDAAEWEQWGVETTYKEMQRALRRDFK